MPNIGFNRFKIKTGTPETPQQKTKSRMEITTWKGIAKKKKSQKRQI
jgi:hypothetical protein